MGCCLSLGSGKRRQGPCQRSSDEVAKRAVSYPDPGKATVGSLLESQAVPSSNGSHKLSTVCSPASEKNLELPSPPINSKVLSEVAPALPGRPKPQFGPQDSRMSVYSDVVEPGLSAEPGLPALPPDAQLKSATVTPAGNVLMQLNRAMILRNRMGANYVLPRIPVKPPLASAGETSHSIDGQDSAGSVTSSTQQLKPPGVAPLDGAGSFPSSSTRHVGGNGFGNTCDSGQAVLPVGCSNAIQGRSLAASGIKPQSGVEPISTGSARSGTNSTISVSTTTPSGIGSGAGSGTSNVAAPLYGLGVEATLGEMQQMALIGSGGGGCVYVGRWRGVRVAVKFIVSSNDDQLTRSQREALLSRLASHPHVVQTYATSVTQLTESLFKAKDDELISGAIPGRMTAANANISHDLLAELTSGSWIRGEVQMTMHGESSTAPAAAVANLLPTIIETVPSSLESASASMTATSGRGVNCAHHTVASISDGQLSSSSMSTRARVGDAPRLLGPEALPTDQMDALNRSANDSGKSSCVLSAQEKLSQTGPCSVGQESIHGALECVPTLGPAAEGPLTGGSAGPGVPCGGSRQGEDALGGRSPTSAIRVAAAAAVAVASQDNAVKIESSESTEEPGKAQSSVGPACTAATAAFDPPVATPLCGACNGSAPTLDSIPALTSAPAAQATRLPASSVSACGLADSFDASFVRNHLGLAKYSIHQVLRQLGAREGEFLTMVVMEYCDGGSLLAALKEGPFHRDTTSWSPRMWLRSTVRTALEIAYGMQHLHISGLVHGDLKPGNVLLKGSNQDKRKFVAKVSDLGVTHPIGTEEEMAIDDGQIGSIAYMAPEVFRGRILKASDVYSFGVLLWQLVCGTGAAPFEGAHPVAIALGVSEGKMTLRWPQGIFRPLQQLGDLCLQTDPAARPSFKSVVGALEKLERHMQRVASAAALAGAPGGSSGGLNVSPSPAPSLST